MCIMIFLGNINPLVYIFFQIYICKVLQNDTDFTNTPAQGHKKRKRVAFYVMRSTTAHQAFAQKYVQGSSIQIFSLYNVFVT